MITLLEALHLLSVVFWVGGMAFAYLILRPAADPMDTPVRQQLWRRVFARFLPWVGIAIVLLLISGYWLIFAVFGGFRGLPLYVNLMQGLGLLMMLLFLHLYFAPWRRFRLAVDRADAPAAGKALGQIRTIVAVNLTLGILTLLAGGTGRFW